MKDEIQKIVEIKYKYKKRVKMVKYFFSILIAFILIFIPISYLYNKWKMHQSFVEFKIENPNDEIEIINKALKIYLDKMHRFRNFSKADIKKRSKYFMFGDTHESYATDIFEYCHGDKKHDDKCEFMTFDKRLNLEYLMNLGERICINGNPIENAKQIVDNDEILQNKKLFYPQDEKALVDENGNFITNFFYTANQALFYDKVFINKNIFSHTNKDFDIIISSNACFARLFFAINEENNLQSFCDHYDDIFTKFDENLPYYEDYLTKLATINFSYIPIKLTKNGAYDILTIEDIAEYRNIYQYGHHGSVPKFDHYIWLDKHNEYDLAFNQYQTLKNNNFNKNLNLQGDGNAKN